MIAAPLAMLIAVRPAARAEITGRGRSARRCVAGRRWAALAVAFIGGAVYSSFLVLRDAPGRAARARLRAAGLPADPARQAGALRGPGPLRRLRAARRRHPRAAGRVPRPDVSPNPEKPFDTGDAYSPIDFDSFSRGTLDRFPYVITGRAAWNSQAPPNFRRIAATPSYVLWKRTGPTPGGPPRPARGDRGRRHCAGCASPEIRILLANRGRASLFPGAVIGAQERLGRAAACSAPARAPSQTLRPAGGRWHLSLQYFSPFDLTLSARRASASR